ncbi:MAG: pyridoxal phosphate-dependent aminotransferase [Nitrospirae bacterium]|nr:pyridoxal phosphate-dependent aminotransferase [Nitrospirota bacterium]
MKTLAERAGSIRPSPTLAIDAKAKAMKASGIDVVGFGVGEPDFDTPEHIKEAGIKAIRDGHTKYMAVPGIDPLKDAIIAKLKRDNGLDYARNEIIVSCGAKHSLYNVAQALYGPGDEVLIPAPYWVSYPDQVMLNGATPVIVPTREEDRFAISAEQLERYITPRTKALILNSPSNPTGLAYDRGVFEAVAALAVKHDFYVVSDEIYEKLVYDGFQHISIASLGPEIKARTFVINGVSKSHAMTGWRMGYTAGPANVIKAMSDIQSQSTSNVCSITQMASIAALNGPEDFLKGMLAEFDKRRRYMVERLNKMPGVSCLMPVGAFYAFPNVSALYGKMYGKSAGGRKINSSADMAAYLLEDANVALVHGEAFGDDRFIRLSYATSMENIEKGLNRIEQALARLA